MCRNRILRVPADPASNSYTQPPAPILHHMIPESWPISAVSPFHSSQIVVALSPPFTPTP